MGQRLLALWTMFDRIIVFGISQVVSPSKIGNQLSPAEPPVAAISTYPAPNRPPYPDKLQCVYDILMRAWEISVLQESVLHRGKVNIRV